ncbi:MAG: hypothetical protein II456_05595, partial [Firmicutes bacterium]|nr:hypothetical protein [Bacillota bacterium]
MGGLFSGWRRITNRAALRVRPAGGPNSVAGCANAIQRNRNHKMNTNDEFRCTGNCEACGRCNGINKILKADNRKTRMMYFPDDFQAESGGEGLGAAFDIGTTTVVGMLWDLKTGRMLDILAENNPQCQYGADVISRITYCGRSEEKLAELSGMIRHKMDEMLRVMCTRQTAAQAAGQTSGKPVLQT